MSEEKNQPLFENNPQALARRDEAAVARATQEIQASLVIGQKFPRDEVKCRSRIMEACKRKGLAEVAEYEYSRGGTKITGATIDLLRAIASRWGNIIWGWSEVERRPGESTVRCWAWDTQSNGRAERTMVIAHWRDTSTGGYELDDERDIYELLANMAARRVRACMEEVIDSDIITDAVNACRETLRRGEDTPLIDRVVKMVGEFKQFGVTQADIERRLGNKADAISENQLASLRRVWKSLKDGVGVKTDYFKPEQSAPNFPSENPKADAAAGLAPVQPAQAAPTGPLAGVVAGVMANLPKPTPESSTSPLPIGSQENGGQNYLKAVRNLCAAAKIKEGKLLDFLSTIGLTDGSSSGLEDLMLSRPDVVKLVHDNWADYAVNLKGGK